MSDEDEKRILALLREGRAAEAHQLVAEFEKNAATAAPTQSQPAPTPPSTRPPVTVAEVIEHYLTAKKGPDALAARSFHGQKSASLTRLMGGLHVHELTAAELTLYERKRRADHVSERTIREELKVLRQSIELGVSANLVEREILAGLGMPPGRASPKTARDPTP